MQLSVLIAAHNEGAHLLRTVEATHNALQGLEAEIIIADDASTDDAVAQVLAQYPEVRVVRHAERRGASPTKHLATTVARGEIFLFLDGHTNPEPHALTELVRDIALHEGRAIVVPAIAQLDPNTWQNHPHQVGYGYTLELTTLQTRWLARAEMTQREREGRTYYESPALIGCCFAISRSLYQELGGMDVDMQQWGVEDLDLGMKAWLHGCAVLVNPAIVIGHRFRKIFDNYPVDSAHILANELRFARKHFSEQTWQQWRLQQERQVAPALWNQALSLFTARRASVEQERLELQAARAYDEFWFAQKFSLPWPQAADDMLLPPQPLRPRFRSMEGSPEPSSEPSPGPSLGPGSGSGSGDGGESCWQDLMANTNLWVRPRMNNAPFNWFRFRSDANGNHITDGNGNIEEIPANEQGSANVIWCVRPAALGDTHTWWSEYTAAEREQIHTNVATGGDRNKHDLWTTQTYSDFNLQFEFRCPDAKTKFTTCGGDPVKDARIYGPRNWGNSGVKIFHQSAGEGLEIQIHDSYDISNSSIPGIERHQNNTGLNSCTIPIPDDKKEDRGWLPFGQICGSIYDKKVARGILNKKSFGWPIAIGEWNTMEIGFMAARYDTDVSGKTPEFAKAHMKKRPTVTVKINGHTVLWRVSIDDILSLSNKGFGGGGTVVAVPDKNGTNPTYEGGEDWYREKGHIFLQEHDNMVEFRKIRINPCWLPMTGENSNRRFDESWQASRS